MTGVGKAFAIAGCMMALAGLSKRTAFAALYDARIDPVEGKLLFPGDSLQTDGAVRVGPDLTYAELVEGIWTNTDPARAYRVSSYQNEETGETGLTVNPEGYVVSVTGGVSFSDDGLGDTHNPLPAASFYADVNAYDADVPSADSAQQDMQLDIASYPEGTWVCVRAAYTQEERPFGHWEFEPQIYLENIASPEVSFLMPGCALSVKAVYAVVSQQEELFETYGEEQDIPEEEALYEERTEAEVQPVFEETWEEETDYEEIWEEETEYEETWEEQTDYDLLDASEGWFDAGLPELSIEGGEWPDPDPYIKEEELPYLKRADSDSISGDDVQDVAAQEAAEKDAASEEDAAAQESPQEVNVSAEAEYEDGPSPAYNRIEGLVEGGEYLRDTKLTFTAVGNGPDKDNPNPGDVRWVPSSYQIGTVSGGWSSSDYTTSMAISAAGTYTLTVSFVKQIFDGNLWNVTSQEDQKSVTFQVVNALAVQTDDHTPVLQFTAAALGALAVMGTAFVRLLGQWGI